MPVPGTPITQPPPVSAPFMTRLRQGWEWIVASKPADAFFGPGQPLPASAPVEASGRQRDYGMLENIQVGPRTNEPVTMEQLLYLADNHDLTRLAIETRKDQLSKIPWSIRKKAKQGGKAKGDLDEDLMAFFECPDGFHSYTQWCRMIWEDMLALDAPAVFVRRNAGGDVIALEPIDGATITPKINAWGRTPLEGTAYTQTIKGLPAIRYGVQDLIYFPRNPRPRHAYGFAPTEQIIVTINIALRRQDYQLQYYQSGSTPDLIIQAPESMSSSVENLRKFREWIGNTFGGNSVERRRGLVIPNGGSVIDTKEKALKDEYDEWLARIVCYAFSLPPTPFVKQMNRGTANTSQQAALQEGLEPFKIWHKEFIAQCLLRMGRTDVELCYEQEIPADPLQRAQIFQIALAQQAYMQVDEVRELEGRDPLPEPAPPPPAPAPTPQGQGPAPASTDEQPQGAAEPPKPEPPPQALDNKPTEKVRLVRKASRRDRAELIAHEGKVSSGVSKRLHDLSKTLVPAIVKAYGETEKAEADPAKKILAMFGADDLKDLNDYLQDQSLDAYGLGVKAAADLLQDNANDAMVHLANEKGVDWAIKHAGERIKDMAGATRDDLTSIVTQAMEEGWSNDELAEKLSESWSFSAHRADLIARTETAFADVQGNVALYKEADVEELTWLAADSDPCDECDAKDGTDRPVDSADVPPAHPGCRCDVVPKTKEDRP